MNKDKVQNQNILGTLVNKDESGIIAYSDQIYDKKADKSIEEENIKQNERLDNAEAKDREFQATLEGITKTGEASAASNVSYNHNDSQLDASNVQQAIDEVYSKGNTDRENDKSELEKSISDNKAAVDASIQDVYKKSNYNDGENIIDFNTIHLITDNPEFICVAVDANDRILYGIKTDGQSYFGIGCPQQVKDYIDKQINKILGTDDISSTIDSLKEIEAFLQDFTNSDTLKALLDTKANVDDVRDIYKKSNPNDDEGNVVDTNSIVSIEDNPEYIQALTDNVGKLIEAIGLDGIRNFFAGINVQGTLQCVTSNPEYIAVWLDSRDNIILGFKADGDVYIGYGIPSQIKDYIYTINADIQIKLNSIGKSLTDTKGKLNNTSQDLANTKEDINKKINLGSNVYPATVHSITDSPEFVATKTDVDGRIISTVDIEGVEKHNTKHVFKRGAEINGLSIDNDSLDNLSKSAIKYTINHGSELIDGLKNNGSLFIAHDWSDYISNDGDNPLSLPEPRCAVINLITDKAIDLTNLSKASYRGTIEGVQYNVPVEVQFWDKQGNYFKKKAYISGQGNSSMAFPKKNIAIDFFDSKYGGDAFSTRFGNWVPQDSYHLKSFYTDFIRGASVVAYKVADLVEEYGSKFTDRPWKRALINSDDIAYTQEKESKLTDLDLRLDNGATCHPEGFPVIVYQNGDFYGVFAWLIKKHRDNYHMNKKNPKNIHLDGELSENTIWNGNINWKQFEIRNPKSLYYKNIQTDKDGNKTYEYDADIAQDEIAGDDEVNAWIAAGQFPNGDKITSKIENNLRNTAKVKNFIIALSKYKAEITAQSTTEGKKELLAKYFDVPSIVDYEIVQILTGDDDGWVKNCQWITYDGIKWYPCEYDKDMSFGNDAGGKYTRKPRGMSGFNRSWSGSIFTTLVPLVADECLVKARELVKNNIITPSAILNLFYDWIDRVGAYNYEKEYDKWNECPCYRSDGIDHINWDRMNGGASISSSKYQSENSYALNALVTSNNRVYKSLKASNNAALSDSASWKEVTYIEGAIYNVGDECYMILDNILYGFKALKQVSTTPIVKSYNLYPHYLGVMDSVWRFVKYIIEQTNAFIDWVNKQE